MLEVVACLYRRAHLLNVGLPWASLWLSLSYSHPPLSPIFFKPGVCSGSSLSLASAFTIPSGFLHSDHIFINRPLLKLSLISPTWMCLLFPTWHLTPWNRGKLVKHKKDWESPGPPVKCTDKGHTWAKAWKRSRNLSTGQRMMMEVREDDKSNKTEGTASGKVFVLGWLQEIANY